MVRDLGRGSSAEVKLCRLLMPPDRVIDNRHTNDNGLSANRKSIVDTVGGGGGKESRSGSSGSGGEGRRRRRASGDTYKERVEGQERGQDHGLDQERDELDGGDLYVRDGGEACVDVENVDVRDTPLVVNRFQRPHHAAGSSSRDVHAAASKPPSKKRSLAYGEIKNVNGRNPQTPAGFDNHYSEEYLMSFLDGVPSSWHC